MKLIFAVIQGKDADNLLTALRENGYRSTQINSAGGFLRENNVTVLIGVEDPYVPDVLRLIEQNCYTRTQYVNPLLPIMEPGEFYVPNPVEVQVGGATVFVLDVERVERIP
ncbi:cyclic-di-AMP receptor [Sphaerobacter sp.]|uniref:cyclic-di-AMP receptor n=1 Tax=Sphaerobacter sp. TaxID=2099654 RepID=UPI001D87B1A8|nr:cyclic-di-AMP receptor [Sphaerobacter sp.]MBX5443581.1 cyclic-di-AMP receptor [Sphaerobacter sp.]